ncbi:MAG: hypothetical protein ACXVCX_14850 [Ktedonobacterales bacterium]
MTKKRILRTILVIDALLGLTALGFHIADQLAGVPCRPARYYDTCSVYFVAAEGTMLLLYGWVFLTLPVVIVILAHWLGHAPRRQKQTHPHFGNPST